MNSYPQEDTTSFAKRAWIGPGGAATNYAVAIAKLNHKAILVARTSDDFVRLGLMEDLRRMGVDTSYIHVAKGEPPGIVVVIVSPNNSSRTMITVRGANEGLTGSLIPGLGDIVHFASVKGRVILEASRIIESRLTSYDPGGEVYRNPGEVMKAVTSGLVNILFINDKELDELMKNTGYTISDLLQAGIETIVIKKGRGGARAYTRNNEYEVDPPTVPKPVDVTGAGDAFDAAFNVCIISGCDVLESLKFAVAAGAAKVLKKGSSNMPDLHEILRMA